MRQGILNGELQSDLDARGFRIKNIGGIAELPLRDYGGIPDGRYVTVSVSGAVLSGSGFTREDDGKTIVLNPGSGSAQIRTVSYTNTSHLALNTSASTVTNVRALIGSDNSAAIRSAVAAAFAASGALITAEAGIYVCAGALQDTSGNNAAILIPDSSYNGLPIYFRGVLPASSLYNDYAQDAALSWPGTVFYCAIQGSGTNPAFIRPERTPTEIANSNLTRTSVRFENILFRSPVNRALHILDFAYGGGLEMDGVSFDTDFDNYSLFPVPTNDFSAITFPISGNSSWCAMRKGCVVGYYRGVDSSEHTILDDVNIFNNTWGLFQRDGFGTTLLKVHFLENIHQIHLDPEASYPTINGFGVEFEQPQGVGGNNLFNTKYIIASTREDSVPARPLAGTLIGVISVPNGTLDTVPSGATESYRDNFNAPYLTCRILGQQSGQSIVRDRRLVDSGYEDSAAMIALGDDSADGGMPFSTIGARMGHATKNTGIFLTKGAGVGMVMIYVPGQNKFYLTSIAAGGFSDAGVVILQPAGRVVIGDPLADDTVSTCVIGGDLVVSKPDNSGQIRIGDTILQKTPGGPLMESDTGLSLGGDVECVPVGNGPVLKSADGTRWRIGVANDGTVSAHSL